MTTLRELIHEKTITVDIDTEHHFAHVPDDLLDSPVSESLWHWMNVNANVIDTDLWRKGYPDAEVQAADTVKSIQYLQRHLSDELRRRSALY